MNFISFLSTQIEKGAIFLNELIIVILPFMEPYLLDHPEAIAAFEVDNVPITSGTTEINLPAGTDIKRLYGTAPNQWYQWDAIRPLMYVTPSVAANKWKYFPEGTIINQITFYFFQRISK